MQATSPASGLPGGSRAGEALEVWRDLTVKQRLAPIKTLRHLVADQAEMLASLVAQVGERPPWEKLMSEVLPLAEACRWLTREAAQVLSPRRLSRRGPLWLAGVSTVVERHPLGKILIIGPGNYPLFLPAVQMLQALVAGNSVLIKPAPGTTAVMEAFIDLCAQAGVPRDLIQLLPEDPAAVREAISAGVDKVVFTGSSENGRRVLAQLQLAPHPTPSVMELSGEDVVLVLEDADLDLAAAAISFGTRLNAGNTCMAPKLVLAAESVVAALQDRVGAIHIEVRAFRHLDHAIREINDAPYGLGASVFSTNVQEAQRVAALIDTGFVVINDIIVPTADARVPFGGCRASGFGVTRGPEGLLEMTRPRVIMHRRIPTRRHLDEPSTEIQAFFPSFIRALHGSHRLRAWGDVVKSCFGGTAKASSE